MGTAKTSQRRESSGQFCKIFVDVRSCTLHSQARSEIPVSPWDAQSKYNRQQTSTRKRLKWEIFCAKKSFILLIRPAYPDISVYRRQTHGDRWNIDDKLSHEGVHLANRSAKGPSAWNKNSGSQKHNKNGGQQIADGQSDNVQVGRGTKSCISLTEIQANIFPNRDGTFNKIIKLASKTVKSTFRELSRSAISPNVTVNS